MTARSSGSATTSTAATWQDSAAETCTAAVRAAVRSSGCSAHGLHHCPQLRVSHHQHSSHLVRRAEKSSAQQQCETAGSMSVVCIISLRLQGLQVKLLDACSSNSA
jgi:hypothetical protein